MNRIKEVRESLNLSRKEIVDKIGVPYRTLQNWESQSSDPQPWTEKLLIAEMKRIKERKEMPNQKKYIIFENRAEVRPGTSVRKMEDDLMEGDPYEVERFNSWDDAKAYLLNHPGQFWTESTFSGGHVTIVEGCYAAECEVDENGEILGEFDLEFAELAER